MTSNIENWKYKTKAEVEALETSVLEEEWKDLIETMKLYHQNRMPMTDEMFWTFVTMSEVIGKRI